MKDTLKAGLADTARFEVSRDSVDPTCRATHARFAVDVASTVKRHAAKAAKAGLA